MHVQAFLHALLHVCMDQAFIHNTPISAHAFHLSYMHYTLLLSMLFDAYLFQLDLFVCIVDGFPQIPLDFGCLVSSC